MESLIIKNLDGINLAASKFMSMTNDRTVIAFEGAMGAGKTTFIKAICKHLGVIDVVNSPTFSIINEYRSNASSILIYHFDFYRINNISEARQIGIEDYFYSGSLCFIEWPEKIKELLPDNAILVKIEELADQSRIVTFEKS